MGTDAESGGRIKKFQATKEEIAAAMEIADRDLSLAKSLCDSSPDWAFSIAYNAMLQAGRAFMMSKGSRPSSESTHIAVIEFLDREIPPRLMVYINSLDIMRRKRHKTVYEKAGLITKSEACKATELSENFIKEIKGILP